MPIPSWSHSRVTEFEKCAFRAYLLHDAKVPEPGRELPKGKTEHANDRGTRIHEACEAYVKGDIPNVPIEVAKHYAAEMEMMRAAYIAGAVQLEGEWGMNQAWEPTGWNGQWIKINDMHLKALVKEKLATGVIALPKKLAERGASGDVVRVGQQLYTWEPAWLRLKLDALVFLSPFEAVAIDYKSGRKFGNEIKHGEQLQLYQLVTFLRHPELETVHTELWYLDTDDITQQTFQRKRGLMFQQKWDKRGTALTTATEFKPNPNPHSCRWCQYGPWNGGQCSVGKRA